VIFEHANRLQDKGIPVTIVCHCPRLDRYEVRVRYVRYPSSWNWPQAYRTVT